MNFSQPSRFWFSFRYWRTVAVSAGMDHLRTN